MRLLFIGIDCLGLYRFERFLKPRLPQIAAWGECHAPLPRTGPSWTSILTGLTMEEHGVTSLLGTAREGSKTFQDLVGKYIFEGLPGSVGVFNLPTTYPPRCRPGDWMISGYPFDPVCCPADLLNGIDYIGDYAHLIVDLRGVEGKSYLWPEEYDNDTAFAIMQLVERVHLRALRRLPGVEYLFVCTTYYDRVAHQCHQLGPAEQNDPLDDAARFVVDWVDQLLDLFSADTVVMVSDHGWSQRENWHSHTGFWCMWGAGVPELGRVDIMNHELRGRVETALSVTDPQIEGRLRALGYVE
ncbi:MAG TPA: hypothetical protein G4O02_13350 [Caldilineae bacterium]|nr:hypothetical protein [Caldilineae bacterium]